MPVFQTLSLLFSLPFSPVTQLFRYLFFRCLFPRDPEKERKKRNSKPQLLTAKMVNCVRQTVWVQWLCETATIVDCQNCWLCETDCVSALAVWDRLCECNHTAKIVDRVRQTVWVQWLCETATIVDSVSAITQPKLLTVWGLWLCETATIVDSVRQTVWVLCYASSLFFSISVSTAFSILYLLFIYICFGCLYKWNWVHYWIQMNL